MDVAALLNRIRSRADYAGQLTHVEILPARTGRFSAPTSPLPDVLTRVLAARRIEQLYSHQTAALEAARSQQDAVIVTGTASGKTLCYNLPILEAAINDPKARALYLFPTKALAQDQLKGLLELAAEAPELAASVRPGVYDGDTPTAQRRRMRGEANLVLSNPDMLHASILPYHAKWGAFFSDLRFVVVDEVHTYRGILGAHVSAVLRRLIRVCEHYGSRPVFIAASATIANPGEFTSQLLGREVAVIDDDGSPRGRKFFALWNPAPLGHDSLARRSANDDAVMWLAEAMRAGGQVLAFTRTRQAAELIFRYTREQLAAERSPLAGAVRAYRGGYLPNERREIEHDLFSGNLRGVAATNALELGIDIGSLDVALLVNYPGTIASTWQQAGRSGRRHDESLAVLLAGNDPVDQYLLRHPQYFFRQTPEQAVVDPSNPYVLARHLPAAAFELPLQMSGPAATRLPSDANSIAMQQVSDLDRFGAFAAPIAAALQDSGSIVAVNGDFYFAGGQNPAVGVSLRHMSDNTFSIVLVDDPRDVPRLSAPRSRSFAAQSNSTTTSNNRPNRTGQSHSVIANVDSISAPELVYAEAVYLHNGETFLVRELDLAGKVAYVERRETDYYTQAVLESNVRITGQRGESGEVLGAAVGYGDADVSWRTVAFKKIKFATRENIGLGPVDLPAQNLQTAAVWLTPGDELRQALKATGHRASEGVVGLRNLAVVALPLIAMCDSRDLGGIVDSQNFGRSTMILYDRYPGGLGYCERGFYNMRQLLGFCLEMVRDCPCLDGCPSCVGLPNLRPAIHSDPDLTRGHPLPNKLATIRLLELLCVEAPPASPSQIAASAELLTR